MDRQRLLHKHKFFNPNVDRIEDTDHHLFKKADKYKIKEIQKHELNPKDTIDFDKERVIKKRTTIVNIDSSDRPIDPKNIYYRELFTLGTNPLEFHPGENRITVTQERHNYSLNDKIAMNNVVGKSTSLKNKLVLYDNSQYVKILDNNHNMTYEYHNIGLNLLMQNVIGNSTSDPNEPNLQTLAGIPTNFFNKRHEILFNVLDEDEDDPMINDPDVKNLRDDINLILGLNISLLNNLPALEEFLRDNLNNEINSLGIFITNLQQIVNKLIPNFYLVKLPIKASSNYIPNEPDVGDNLENSNILIRFLHVFGIPIEFINADYPLGINRRVGNHVISKIVDLNTYEILIGRSALEPRETFGTNIFQGGGLCIEVVKIKGLHEGFPDPNHYKIFFNRTFHNVKEVQMISSIFPNTEKVFRQFPENERNNKLYWNDLDDGVREYSICIVPGNYTASLLVLEMEQKFAEVRRETHDQQVMLAEDVKECSNSVDPTPIYAGVFPDATCFLNFEENHIIKPSINVSTDVVTFASFKKVFLKQAIAVGTNPDTGLLVLNIFSPYHNFDEEDVGITKITIENAKNTEQVPASAINGEHTIVAIGSTVGGQEPLHVYQVELDDFEPLTGILIATDTFGGDFITITYPDKFRMRFDKPDTMGVELGFNSVGKENAITEFGYTVNNFDFYDVDVPFNSIGIDINRKNLVLQLSGEPYFLISNELLNNFQNTGPVEQVFAKIQLQDVPCTVLYNTYVADTKVFDDPITSLSELEFFFYSPNGTLYDFNGANHSFCLKITELISLPKNTHISARTNYMLQAFEPLE